MISFENEEFIFPSVHHAFRFSLLTLQASSRHALPEFAFFLRQSHQLADSRRRFTLSPVEISRINPNTKTAPIFRSKEDAELTAKIYARIPVLIDDAKGADGNPWGISSWRCSTWRMTAEYFAQRCNSVTTAWYKKEATGLRQGHARNPSDMYLFTRRR